MKKTALLIASLGLLAGCYDDYTMDYDYTGAYFTYQYDLRTFVYGEDTQVGFTVCLGGTVHNDRDRKVDVEIKDNLLSTDLSIFDETGELGGFKAIDGLKGNGNLGTLSNSYVSNEVSAAGISDVTPLPADYYTAEGIDGLTIKKGRHTAEVFIKPTEKMFKDANALKPYYAIGMVINKADVDSLLKDRSFEIMAVKVENQFYGSWYHGGRVQVRKNKDGELISEDYKSILIPQTDNKICALTTTGLNTSVTDKFDHSAGGSLNLKFNEDGTIDVSDASGAKELRPITGNPSHFNGAKLLQEREIYLNYSYSNGNGTTTYVTDTLKFRNRMRDGFNEWRSEKEEDYE